MGGGHDNGREEPVQVLTTVSKETQVALGLGGGVSWRARTLVMDQGYVVQLPEQPPPDGPV